VPAASAWLAGTQDASAVVIDIAGPVPLAVDGARLAALAAGRPVPLPHQDPEVLGALRAALADEPLIVQAALTTPGQRIAGPGGGAGAHGGEGAGADAAAWAATSPRGTGLDNAGVDGPSWDGPSWDGPGWDGAEVRDYGEHEPNARDENQDGAGGRGAGDHGANDHDADDQDAADYDPGRDSAGDPGQPEADLALQVTVVAGCDAAAAEAAIRRVADALLAATGGRLRRGVQVSLVLTGPAAGSP
jgi:hypothetical protein